MGLETSCWRSAVSNKASVNWREEAKFSVHCVLLLLGMPEIESLMVKLSGIQHLGIGPINVMLSVVDMFSQDRGIGVQIGHGSLVFFQPAGQCSPRLPYVALVAGI